MAIRAVDYLAAGHDGLLVCARLPECEKLQNRCILIVSCDSAIPTQGQFRD